MRALLFPLAVVVSACLIPQPAIAAVIGQTSTNLTGSADRMISYRHQKHSWITDDGMYQLFYNRGKQTTNDALQLSTSPDGSNWTPALTLPDTNYTSTADGSLKDGLLSVVYSSKASDIRFAPIRYNAAKRSWDIKGPGQTVRAKVSGVPASNPSLVEDPAGNFWVVFLEQAVNPDGETGTAVLRLYYREAGGKTWIDTGVKFGDTGESLPLNTPKRSARLVLTPGGLGVIYAVDANIYWRQRPMTGLPSDNWSDEEPLVIGVPGQDVDPYASHFSVTTDGGGGMHLAYTDGGTPYYTHFDAKKQSWTSQNIPLSTSPISAGYPQVSWLGGDQIALVFDSHPADAVSHLLVFQSASLGAQGSFRCTDVLTHPNPKKTQDGSNFGHMRNEMPAVAPAGGVPVLMQYQQTVAAVTTYKAYAYKFTADDVAGCSSQ